MWLPCFRSFALFLAHKSAAARRPRPGRTGEPRFFPFPA
jgi:hypothetical protein